MQGIQTYGCEDRPFELSTAGPHVAGMNFTTEPPNKIKSVQALVSNKIPFYVYVFVCACVCTHLHTYIYGIYCIEG